MSIKKEEKNNKFYIISTVLFFLVLLISYLIYNKCKKINYVTQFPESDDNSYDSMFYDETYINRIFKKYICRN